MKTLYDLLGALADDDAESLRTAFRKAAKATHPDLNAGDPDAPLRFRQIFRAHAILSDPEQRAAYDWLLASAASEEACSQPKPIVLYHTIHKLASGVIAFTILSVVLVGGYTLFGHISKASVIPDSVIEAAAPGPAEIAAVAPTPQPDTTARGNPSDQLEGVEIPSETTVSSAALPAANAGSAEVTGGVGPAPDLAATDATSYRERGIVAYRGGDLHRAIADFDRAIKLDSNYADAYIDRGIALYRTGEFDRAFADMAHAKRIQNARRTRHQASASSGRN